MNTKTVRSIALVVLAVVPRMYAVAPAEAQASPDPGWSAWVGCWETVTALDDDPGFVPTPPSEPETLCVLPTTDPRTVEVATLVNGAVIQREQIAATGARVAVEREGCIGWESMEMSADGRRVYRDSEFDCGGQLLRRTSGLFGILPWGEWLDVQGMSVGDYSDVQVTRYRQVAAPPVVSEEMTAALQSRRMQIEAARTAAAARVDLAEVIDATRHVDAAVVEGWLIEQNQGFGMNASRLATLADADVPGRVIDLMVALSYPGVFTIDRSAREGEFVESERVASVSPRRTPSLYDRLYDPYYDRYYDPYYDRYDPRYGYYGYSSYGGRLYGAPVIIVRGPVAEEGEPQENSRPRLVNGRGFSRGNDRESDAPSGSTGSSGSTSGGSSGTASGRSSDSSQSSDDSEDAPRRTAKPRSTE